MQNVSTRLGQMTNFLTSGAGTRKSKKVNPAKMTNLAKVPPGGGGPASVGEVGRYISTNCRAKSTHTHTHTHTSGPIIQCGITI